MRFAGVSFTAVLLLALAHPAMPQTLAHPNWVGNGMSTDPWWQHAVIYRVQTTAQQVTGAASPAVDYKYLAARVHALRSIGVDALLLPAPAIPAAASAPEPPSASVQSELDQLDDLTRAASSRGLRVLLTLAPASTTADLSGIARFWLSRGIAGFYVSTPAGASRADMLPVVQSLRRLTAAAVGQRIVISDVDPATTEASVPLQSPAPIVRRPAAGRAPRSSDIAPELELDPRAATSDPTAASVRAMLVQTANQPNLLIDLDGSARGSSTTTGRASLSRVIATLSLLTHPAALVDSNAHLVLDPMPEHTDAEVADPSAKRPAAPAPTPGVYLPYKPYVPPSKAHPEADQPPPKDPLTAWYKQLGALHHTHPAIRSGTAAFLNFDSQNAVVWVARSASGSPSAAPIVVACNLSPKPAELTLRAAMESLGLKGSYLRTLLRSDNLMGPQEITSVTVPAYGVYIGELRR